MRLSLRYWLSGGLMIVLLAFCFGNTRAATPVMDEINLSADGELFEIHQDADGFVYISDHTKGEIWKINPQSGAYTKFYGISFASHARPDNNGKIWFTNQADVFGYIDPTLKKITDWQVTPPVGEVFSFGPLSADANNKIWIAEWIGATSKLYRFNPDSASREWCVYPIPHGSSSYSLNIASGTIWFANYQYQRIMNFDPNTNTLVEWQLSNLSAAPKGQVIYNNHFWWADPGLKTINEFDPDTNMMAAYTLLDNSKPSMVAFQENMAWFTDPINHQIGSIDLNTVTPTDEELFPTPTPDLDPACVTLAAGFTRDVSYQTGTLSWTDGNLTTVQEQNGLNVYQMVTQAEPYGLVNVNGTLYITDQGRQKLVRLEMQNDFHVFLPFIKR